MPEDLQTAGVLLITIPAIEFGGLSLLRFLANRVPGYMDNPLRQNLFRAGHAHAGVMVLLALVGLLYLGSASLGDGTKSVLRTLLILPPILMPLGFFLSVASPAAERPNKLIWLVPLGGAALGVAALTLGIGLIRA